MKTTYYPLTAAQKLHESALHEFDAPQILNIGVCLTLQADLDFGLLKKCIQLEYERYESLRVRFTKPNEHGEIFQYIVPHEDRDIRFVDFRGKTLDESYEMMEQRSAEPFERIDSPMNEFIMVSLPEGYQGIYIRIDHTIADSSSVIVMVNDIMELYCHYAFGNPYPADLQSYEKCLQKDFEKASNQKRKAKDEAFWKEQVLLGEPIYTDVTGPWKLEESRKKHKNPKLRAADREMKDLSVGRSVFYLEPEPTQKFLDYCMLNDVSVTNVLLMAMRTYLSKMNHEEKDISIRNYVSRRSARIARTSGGTRVHCFPCRTIIEPDTEFLDGVRMIQSLQNEVYRHVDYDSLQSVKNYMDYYDAPKKTTYESMALTYQPIPIRLQNKQLRGIPYHAKWFTNGTAIQKFYLTVMHSSENLGMEFYVKFQRAELSDEDVEQVYYYLMRILFLGIEHPELTVKEIMDWA